MIRVSAFLQSCKYVWNAGKGRLPTTVNALAKRRFSSQFSFNQAVALLKDERITLTTKEGKVRRHPAASLDAKVEETFMALDKLVEKGKKQIEYADHDPSKTGLMSPPPNTIEGILAWRSIKAEKMQRNLTPERRKMIEKAASDGAPYYQDELKKIQAHEKGLAQKK